MHGHGGDFAVGVFAADSLEYLFAAVDAARRGGQEDKYREFGGGEPDGPAGDAHGLLLEVDHDVAREDGVPGGSPRGRGAEEAIQKGRLDFNWPLTLLVLMED